MAHRSGGANATPRFVEISSSAAQRALYTEMVALDAAATMLVPRSVLGIQKRKYQSQVIEEKKQLGIRNNALDSELEQEKQKSTNARPFREPSDSLRKRTMRAADELHEYLEKRAEGRPPDAWPNSNEPVPSPERKAAIKLSQSYAQETQDYYMKHFKDRLMGIVKEYESIGVPTRYLENDFKQRVPGIAEAGSAWEGMDDLSRFRELAYRVDARNHLIVF